MTRGRRRQLARLARQMNRQGGRWLPVTCELLDGLEIAIRPDEAAFLLNTKGRSLKREALIALSELPPKAFDTLFAGLQKKGLLLLHSGQHDDELHSLAPFFVGWLECYMTGEDSPERTEFARRMRIYFDSFRKFNIPPLRELHNFQARWTRPPQTVLPLEAPQVSAARGDRIDVNNSLEIPACAAHTPATSARGDRIDVNNSLEIPACAAHTPATSARGDRIDVNNGLEIPACVVHTPATAVRGDHIDVNNSLEIPACTVHASATAARGDRVVVGISLDVPASEVHTPASVLEIVERHGTPGAIGLIRCFCREMSRRADEPCRYNLPAEACLVLGPMVEHAVRFGIGRRITKEAALEKIREAAQLGAMHTVFQQGNLGGLQEVAICNCCRDCCVLLGSNARGLTPLRYKAFWLARVADAGTCSHCGECERRCPVTAICSTENGPIVDEKRCLGCGQCTNNCPTNTLELVPDERYVLIPLGKPEDSPRISRTTAKDPNCYPR